MPAMHLVSKYYIKKEYLQFSVDILIYEFSLHPLKTITSGEGGIICTNKNLLNKKLLQTRSWNYKKQKNSLEI